MGLLTKFITIALLFSLFLISSITLFSDLDSIYEANKTTDFNRVYKSLNASAIKVSSDTQGVSRDMSDKLLNTSTGTVDTPEQSLIAGTTAALKTLFRMPDMASNLLLSVLGYIGVPTWYINFFVGIVIGIVLIFITALLIKLFFKRSV